MCFPHIVYPYHHCNRPNDIYAIELPPWRLGDGPDGADDAGEARPPRAAEDVQPAEEVYVGRGEPGQPLAGRHIALGQDGLEGTEERYTYSLCHPLSLSREILLNIFVMFHRPVG